jgi:2-polyprenyl-3-methyl-5-hydroxy-6-metoxy-1,4-benzoquinol methylase
MKQPNCEVCSQTIFKELFEKDGQSYQKCTSCGLIRIYPQTSDEQLNEIYQHDYNQIWGNDESVYRNLKKHLNLKLLKPAIDLVTNTITRERKKPIRLLDIGAATGMLMETAQELGCKVYGVEIGEKSVETLKNKFGNDNIVDGYFEQIDFESLGMYNSFDIISMVDLLEHVRDPNRTLEQANLLLRDSGIVVCYIPNTASLAARILGRNWELYCSMHLYSFSKQNLKMLFNKHGFEIISIKPSPRYLTVEYVRNFVKYQLKDGIAGKLLPIMNCIPHFLSRIIIPCYTGQVTVLARKLNNIHQ